MTLEKWYSPQPKRIPRQAPPKQPKRILPLGFFYPESAGGIWFLDTGEGDTAYDSSDHENDGTIYGATWVDGKVGQALDFDGVDDYVGIGDPDSLEPTDYMTVSFWFKSTVAANEYQSVVRHDGHVLPLQLTNNGTGRPVVFIGGTPYHPTFDWSNWNDGNWHFYVFTFDKDVGTKVYIDNMTNPVATSGATGTLDTTTDPWQLGRAEIDAEYWDGALDEVRIYDRVLSKAETSLLYAISKGVKEWKNL